MYHFLQFQRKGIGDGLHKNVASEYIHISPTRQVSNRHVILDSAVIAHMVVLSK